MLQRTFPVEQSPATAAVRATIADHLKANYRVYTLAAYVVLLAVLGLRHERWFDEAQAWLLAKDLSVADLLAKYLRYEGSPGLWHLILAAVSKAGLPYFTVNVISGVFSTVGVYLFLRYSPFPIIVKLLFPFTYFAFFQYAVVARSYCLVPLLLFLLAITYRTRTERPYLFVLPLCLLANVSTHGLLISGGIFSVHLLEVLKDWKRLDGRSKLNQLAAASILACAAGVAVLVLVPPPDLTFARRSNFGIYHFFKVSSSMLSRSLTVDSTIGVGVLLRLQQAAALAVFVITLVWLWRRQKLLLYLSPLAALLLLFAVKWNNVWHEGILFFLWLFALWVSFEGEGGKGEESGVARKVMIAALVVVFSVHVYWSAHAFHHDFYRSYSGSLEVANYIKANGLENAKIAAFGYKSVAVLPYFAGNIFDNHNGRSKQRFWFWSTRNRTIINTGTKAISFIKREQPEVVIFTSGPYGPLKMVPIDGYQLVGSFDGKLCWKTGVYEHESYLVFRKEGATL